MNDDQAYQEDPAVDYGRPYNGPQHPVRRSCTGWISKQGTCFFHIGFQVGIIHSSKVFLCKWLSFISAAVSNCFMQMCFVFSSSWHSSLAGVLSRISGSGSQKRGSSTTRPTLSRSKTNLPTRSSIIRIDNFPWTLSLNLFFFLSKTMITLKRLFFKKSIFILIINSPFFLSRSGDLRRVLHPQDSQVSFCIFEHFNLLCLPKLDRCGDKNTLSTYFVLQREAIN